jgi:hypothetical protein
VVLLLLEQLRAEVEGAVIPTVGERVREEEVVRPHLLVAMEVLMMVL